MPRIKVLHFQVAVIVCITILFSLPKSSFAQSATPVMGSGQACANSSVGSWCTGFQMGFHPAGGPVATTVNFSTSTSSPAGNIQSTTVFHFTGYFAGGDGGQVAGNFTADTTLSGYVGGSCAHSGTWGGTLYASGSGSGNFAADSGSCTSGIALTYSGSWNISYSVEDFQRNLGPTQTPTKTITPTLTASPTLKPTSTPNPEMQATLEALYSQFSGVKEAIFNKVNEIKDWTEASEPVEPLLIPWVDGKLVVVKPNIQGQAVIQDIYGNQVPITENGEPQGSTNHINSPSQNIIAQNAQLDWLSLLTNLMKKTQEYIAWEEDYQDPITDSIFKIPGGYQLGKQYMEFRDKLAAEYSEYEKELMVQNNLSKEQVRMLEREAFIQGLLNPIGQFASTMFNDNWLQTTPPDELTESYQGKTSTQLIQQLEAIREDPEHIKPELIEKIDLLLEDQRLGREGMNDLRNFWLVSNYYISEQGDYDRLMEQYSATAKIRKEIGITGIQELADRGIITKESASYYQEVIKDKTLKLDYESSRKMETLIETFHSLEPIQKEEVIADNSSVYSNWLGGLNRILNGATEANIQINAMESGD